MNDRGKPTVGFALGGLAGNNAHGAGFLQAALDAGVEPQMISCTSGQIRWVFEYLRGSEARQGASLRDLMEEMIAREEPYGNKTLDLAALSLFGMPGVLCTPHLGASTEDAQNNVATEAAELLIDFFTTGAIKQSVNMPARAASSGKSSALICPARGS